MLTIDNGMPSVPTGTMEVSRGEALREIAEVPFSLAGLQVDAVVEVETWLQTQAEPEFALWWRPSGARSVRVRSTAQLTDCLEGCGA
ncbi:hypothetical protein G7085_20425 [Tessaracoccus sp. HDW20]|uniref:hypothetical protein n=1 Tax=Tessaracoccus coleopterorum TaxID=2714950 RepID=UPI0018D2ED97|nr:hypothetical protein [Tessaracoccus coleopterorum]NHB86091.1 hypothetical protein [Tessaracoccus coleopterorum]